MFYTLYRWTGNYLVAFVRIYIDLVLDLMIMQITALGWLSLLCYMNPIHNVTLIFQTRFFFNSWFEKYEIKQIEY